MARQKKKQTRTPEHYRLSKDLFTFCHRCKVKQWHTNIEHFVPAYMLGKAGIWLECNICRLKMIHTNVPERKENDTRSSETL